MASTTVASPSRTSWTIDADHSDVGFAVKHLMVASVRGSFRAVTGRIVIDEQDFAKSFAEVSIDADSIDTHQEQRDAHLRSADFFAVEAYPEIVFRSRRVEGNGERFRLIGDLTIRGTTREVTLDVEQNGRVTDPWGGERIGYRARTTIDRREFGLTWNQVLETGGIAVANDIRITIDLETVRN